MQIEKAEIPEFSLVTDVFNASNKSLFCYFNDLFKDFNEEAQRMEIYNSRGSWPEKTDLVRASFVEKP